jgi:DNA-binding NarL/FixJ family response regulator
MIEEVGPKETKKAKRVTPPVKKKIIEMAADGMSADVIAEELELSIDQVEKQL